MGEKEVNKKKSIFCGSCTKVECSKNYPEGIPEWCAASGNRDIIEQTKAE